MLEAPPMDSPPIVLLPVPLPVPLPAPQPAPTRAPAFRVQRTDFAGIDAVALTGGRSGSRAVFALRGATLLAWEVVDGGDTVALTDGYRDAAELDSQDGVRNGVLAPFTNRIADARYSFDGRDHDLLPGISTAAGRVVYHGFLRDMALRVIDTRESDTGAEVLFSGAIEPEDHAGYPFALALTVRVRFSATGLGFVVTATNVGEQAAPYAAGWHPYFRLGEAPIDTLELTVPATRSIVTDSRLLPLPGAAARSPVADGPLPDFRVARVLGRDVIDGCYAGLIPDGDGLVRSRLRDPASGRQLSVWQRGGLVHVFTGDTLARDPRRALAIEPVETMTDAFNRADCTAALRLAPGQSRSFAFGAEFVAATPTSPPSDTPCATAVASGPHEQTKGVRHP